MTSDAALNMETARAGLRPISALTWPDVTPAPAPGAAPDVRHVTPGSLYIEERYQRSLGERSLALIRKIVREFNWSAFKPPICAEVEGIGLVVIDGQHTAIAAASHGEIATIPVLVVDADGLTDRAKAFLRHNIDRVALTPMQLHHSAVAAGDEVAIAMEQVAERAGIRILRFPPPYGKYGAGETMAIGALRRLTEVKGVVFTARVMTMLREADRIPIKANEIKAMAELLGDPEYKGSLNLDRLAATIRARGWDQWETIAETTVRKGRKIPMARALAIAWFQAAPKLRGAA